MDTCVDIWLMVTKSSVVDMLTANCSVYSRVMSSRIVRGMEMGMLMLSRELTESTSR